MGNLGFLATFSPDEALEKFVPLLQGAYQIENRQLLECCCPGNDKVVALNDVVIKGKMHQGWFLSLWRQMASL